MRAGTAGEEATHDAQVAAGKVLQHKGYPGMPHRDTTRMLPDALKILDSLRVPTAKNMTAIDQI